MISEDAMRLFFLGVQYNDCRALLMHHGWSRVDWSDIFKGICDMSWSWEKILQVNFSRLSPGVGLFQSVLKGAKEKRLLEIYLLRSCCEAGHNPLLNYLKKAVLILGEKRTFSRGIFCGRSYTIATRKVIAGHWTVFVPVPFTEQA